MGAGSPNCEYGTSCIGILKIVTIVIGIIVVILLFVGTSQAHHFHHAENRRGNCQSFGESNDKNCPKKWMIVLPAWICFFGCAISAIGLITMLLVKLNYFIIILLDFIFHIVFGILIIFSGIFALCYASLAFGLNDCEGWERDHCNHQLENLHKPSFFLPASLFAIINGIIYIIVGSMMVKRHRYR